MILSSPVISSLNHASPWASLPISVAMTTGISCGVRKSNKAPVATAIRSINLCESVEHVRYSHHTQKCFAADWTLLNYLLIVLCFLLRVSNSSWKQQLPVQISNQGSYPQCRPANCKTEPFCAILSFVPKVAPISAPDSLPGASGQLYCAASWLVTVYTILESHLTHGSVQGLSPRILYLFYAKNGIGSNRVKRFQ